MATGDRVMGDCFSACVIFAKNRQNDTTLVSPGGANTAVSNSGDGDPGRQFEYTS